MVKLKLQTASDAEVISSVVRLLVCSINKKTFGQSILLARTPIWFMYIRGKYDVTSVSTVVVQSASTSA